MQCSFVSEVDWYIINQSNVQENQPIKFKIQYSEGKPESNIDQLLFYPFENQIQTFEARLLSVYPNWKLIQSYLKATQASNTD